MGLCQLMSCEAGPDQVQNQPQTRERLRQRQKRHCRARSLERVGRERDRQAHGQLENAGRQRQRTHVASHRRPAARTEAETLPLLGCALSQRHQVSNV